MHARVAGCIPYVGIAGGAVKCTVGTSYTSPGVELARRGIARAIGIGFAAGIAGCGLGRGSSGVGTLGAGGGVGCVGAGGVGSGSCRVGVGTARAVGVGTGGRVSRQRVF